MNLREKLFLHTDLKSEQVHTLEKVFEHNCFFDAFYEDLAVVIPGRIPGQAAVVTAGSHVSVKLTEDPELVSLVNAEHSFFQMQTSNDNKICTPMVFGEKGVMAVLTYKEKVRAAAPSLQKFAECCRQGLYDRYPVNYLVPDGIIIVDVSGKVEFSNFVAQCICRRVGISADYFSEIIEGMSLNHPAFQEFFDKPTFTGDYLRIGDFDISVIVNPLFSKNGLIGAFVILSDLTMIKKNEKELIKKSTVIREIHHRVKNNLQTITSLLRLQMRRTNSKPVEKAFNESINRILSIALIHEALSHQELEVINIKQTVYKILEMILTNMVAPNKVITGEICGDDVYLTALQASNLSLCVTELIQNAVEHAFVKQTEGVIRISIERHDGEVNITVQDNGIGISSEGIENVRSLGMQIVNNITQNNLNGSFVVKGSRTGTIAHIQFPVGIREGGDDN